MTIGSTSCRHLLTAGATVAVSALVLSVGPASSQDTGGLRLVAEGALRLSYDDNPELVAGGSDAETRLGTRLTFGIESESRVQTISLRLSGEYVLRDGGTGEPREFLGPDLSFGYRREGATSDFTLTATRTEREVRDTFAVLADPGDPLSPSDLILDDGTLESTDISARLRTGLEGPLGFEIGVAASSRQYRGTVNPDLEDGETLGADIALRARLSPQIDGRLTASVLEERTDNTERTRRQTTRLGTGLTFALDPIRTLDVAVGGVRIETTETLGGVRGTSTEDGLSFGLSYTEERPRGFFTMGLDRDFLSSGGITTARVGQSIALPTGQLDYNVGIGMTDDGDFAPVGRLSLTQETRRSAWSAEFVAALVPDDDDAVATMSLELGYTEALTESLGLTLAVNYGVTSPLGDSTDPERRRATVEASLTRELTRDWGLTAGYIGRYSKDEGSDSAWSNGAFVEIGRSFSIRP